MAALTGSIDGLMSIDGWAIEDKRAYLALLKRRDEIAKDRERAEREARAREEHAAMMAEIERDAAAVREACGTFAEFVKRAWHVIEPGTPLKWNWHMQAMCDHLEAISRGTLAPRLIINVPPGSSKSTIVTVLWQAWEWGPLGKRHLRYVSTSFELANVKRDTGKTRDVIKSEWYQALWPEVVLKTDGVLWFSNEDTGSRMGVAFASVTGKRGDRLVVDDPHSLEGAESEVQRKATIQKFIEGGLNRVNDWETSAIVIVMQRLHEDDLTGALLAKDFGFTHLMIPLEFEPARRCTTPLQVDDGQGGKKDWTDPRSYMGEPMDRVRFGPNFIAATKLIGEYAYNGQYQQRPAPREGGMFKVDLITIVDHAPPGGTIVGGWDIAGSKRKTSPYSVRLLMKRIGGDFYIMHVDRRRTNPTELNAMVKDVVQDDANDYGKMNVLQSLPQDPGAAGKVVKWSWSDLLAGFLYKITPETGDKVTRADPLAAQVGAGRVHMVKGDWNSDFIEEARNFPAGRYKDQIDAASRAFGELAGDSGKVVNAAPEIVEVDSAAEQERMAVEAEADGVDPWGG